MKNDLAGFILWEETINFIKFQQFHRTESAKETLVCLGVTPGDNFFQGK